MPGNEHQPEPPNTLCDEVILSTSVNSNDAVNGPELNADVQSEKRKLYGVNKSVLEKQLSQEPKGTYAEVLILAVLGFCVLLLAAFFGYQNDEIYAQGLAWYKELTPSAIAPSRKTLDPRWRRCGALGAAASEAERLFRFKAAYILLSKALIEDNKYAPDGFFATAKSGALGRMSYFAAKMHDYNLAERHANDLIKYETERWGPRSNHSLAGAYMMLAWIARKENRMVDCQFYGTKALRIDYCNSDPGSRLIRGDLRFLNELLKTELSFDMKYHVVPPGVQSYGVSSGCAKWDRDINSPPYYHNDFSVWSDRPRSPTVWENAFSQAQIQKKYLELMSAKLEAPEDIQCRASAVNSYVCYLWSVGKKAESIKLAREVDKIRGTMPLPEGIILDPDESPICIPRVEADKIIEEEKRHKSQSERDNVKVKFE